MAVGKRSSERALQKVLGQGANVNEANPLEVHDPKVGSLISYEGVTTADGAGDGSSLIDNVLTTRPDYNGNLVIITSGAYAGQGRDINGATTGGTVTPASAFGGQILSGTSFVILALRFTSASIATGPYTYTDAGGEQDVYEDTATTRRKVSLCVSNRNMTQAGTFRIYRQVDGANYDLWIEQGVTVGAGAERAWDKEWTTSLAWKITYEENVDEGADRGIPYEVVTQVKE